MIERQVASRYAPRSLVGLMTQAAANPSDISRPPAQQATQRFLTRGKMFSDGDGMISVGLEDGSVRTGTLLTDEPLFKDQEVWISPTSTGAIGIHGSVR